MPKSSSWRALLAAVIVYAALWVVAPKVHFLPKTMLLVLGTVAFMAAEIAIVYYYSLLDLKWWQSLLAMAVCLSSSALAVLLVSSRVIHVTRIMGYYAVPRMLVSLLIILAAASVGCAVAVRIKDKNLLLPVVMFAAYIDFWTVTRGPVAAMLEHAPQLAQAVSVPIPVAGAGAFVPLVSIGPGDFLFMGLVFSAVSRLGMSRSRNYWFVFKMMTLAMLAVVVGILPSLPALIALAVAVIAANWREFKLSKQEAIYMAVVGVLLLGSLPLIWSVLAPKTPRHQAPERKPAVAAPARQ